jgi:7,8-dihydropterin-6-yl-methyl-4-(beta-D-ribofuranosyl)aminobenzene 5'-phosphate synthase
MKVIIHYARIFYIYLLVSKLRGMKITVLAENSVCRTNTNNLKAEHGLSLFIESGDRRILFDLGQSGLFLKNAEKMGIDLSVTDTLVISHGHFDHGGGLKHFLEINKSAKIFLHKRAARMYYTKILGFIPYYVGLDRKVLSENINRLEYIDNNLQIDDKLALREGFTEVFPQPGSNKYLFEMQDDILLPDRFRHELVMMLSEKNEFTMFSGCSHSGIINMLEDGKSYAGGKRISAVFGGLHIHNPVSRKSESPAYLRILAEAMNNVNSIFYTCHCTGEKNFRILKEILGDKMQIIRTGDIVTI